MLSVKSSGLSSAGTYLKLLTTRHRGRGRGERQGCREEERKEMMSVRGRKGTEMELGRKEE